VLTLHDGSAAEVAEALTLTTHFLTRAMPAPGHQDGALPEARARLLDQLSRPSPDPDRKSVAD
jgi:hypothetical protein